MLDEDKTLTVLFETPDRNIHSQDVDFFPLVLYIFALHVMCSPDVHWDCRQLPDKQNGAS